LIRTFTTTAVGMALGRRHDSIRSMLTTSSRPWRREPPRASGERFEGQAPCGCIVVDAPTPAAQPSGRAVTSFLHLVKYGIILVFLINVVLQVRWRASSVASPPNVPGTVVAKGGPSDVGLHELIDEDANERDWADFAGHAPLLTDKDRERLRKAEAGLDALDRIYYINLPHRPLRRAMMEAWLGNQSSSVPFHRIEPIRGTSNVENCVSHKRDPPARCFGITSLARTLAGIIRQKDVHGLTLVLEDDYQVTMPLNELVRISLQMVPDDWDIIRWDCSGGMHALASPRRVGGNATLARTVLKEECSRRRQSGVDAGSCWFCGGSHVHMWRGSSTDRLANVWSEMPYNDVDCRLSTPDLNSYCLNFDGRVGRFMHDVLPGEFSDVTHLKPEAGKA
jgi:hypothetical protein